MVLGQGVGARAAALAVVIVALGVWAGPARAGTADDPPRCFGAASRDPHRHCRNPALWRTGVPRPAVAQIPPSSPCRALRAGRGKSACDPCAFGVGGRRSRGPVALLGDSRARMWRAAL